MRTFIQSKDVFGKNSKLPLSSSWKRFKLRFTRYYLCTIVLMIVIIISMVTSLMRKQEGWVGRRLVWQLGSHCLTPTALPPPHHNYHHLHHHHTTIFFKEKESSFVWKKSSVTWLMMEDGRDPPLCELLPIAKGNGSPLTFCPLHQFHENICGNNFCTNTLSKNYWSHLNIFGILKCFDTSQSGSLARVPSWLWS